MTERKFKNENDRIVIMGGKLRELRKKEGLTIAAFAEYLDLSDRMISNYERGTNSISLEFIIKLYESKVFSDRSLEELLHILVIEIYS